MMSSIEVSVMPSPYLLDGCNLYRIDMQTGAVDKEESQPISQFAEPLHGWIQGGLYRINRHLESQRLSASLVSRIEKRCSEKSRRKSALKAAR